jgi:hypothetical protein
VLSTTHLAYAAESNYFGECNSDDVILAKDGKFYRPCYGQCNRDWEYAGWYKKITPSDKAIEAHWIFNAGAVKKEYTRTYFHMSLREIICARRVIN